MTVVLEAIGLIVAVLCSVAVLLAIAAHLTVAAADRRRAHRGQALAALRPPVRPAHPERVSADPVDTDLSGHDADLADLAELERQLRCHDPLT